MQIPSNVLAEVLYEMSKMGTITKEIGAEIVHRVVSGTYDHKVNTMLQRMEVKKAKDIEEIFRRM